MSKLKYRQMHRQMIAMAKGFRDQFNEICGDTFGLEATGPFPCTEGLGDGNHALVSIGRDHPMLNVRFEVRDDILTEHRLLGGKSIGVQISFEAMENLPIGNMARFNIMALCAKLGVYRNARCVTGFADVYPIVCCLIGTSRNAARKDGKWV